MTQMAFDFGDGREQLDVPAPLCPVCGADGTTPCGWWTGQDCFEPNGWPLHREGQPWVHGKRGEAERHARLAAAGIEPWASAAR